MATSGSFQSNTGVACNIKVEWSQAMDIANNKSTVTVKAYLLHNTISVGARTLVIACMGQSQSISVPAINIMDRIGNTTAIGTATFTVDHNGDGSKSGTISATINPFTVTYSGVYLASLSASATVVLDTIPRKSTFTVSATSIDMGENLTFTISRASNSFTHNIRYAMTNSVSGKPGTSGTLATGVATTKTWTVPLDLASYTTTATENNVVLTVDTYDGSGNYLGSNGVVIKVKVPASLVPGVMSVTTTPTSTNGVVNGWGIFVQNHSKAVCVISTSIAYNAPITTYAVTYDGSTVSSASSSVTTDKVMSRTSNTITVTVTDARGRSASKTITVNAHEYIIPSLGNIRCFRSDASGNEKEEGTYCYAAATKSYATCGGKNTVTATFNVVRKTDGAVVTSGTLNDGTNIISGLTATNVYITTLSIRDALGNGRDYTYTLATVSVGLNLYPSKKGGAAFGKYAEKEKALDVGDWEFIAGVGEFNKGTYVSDTGSSGFGSVGYIVLARMEITGPWITYSDIEFDIQCSNDSGKVLFRFNNPPTAAETRVSWFTADYPLPPMYYTLTVNANSVTIDLIAQKSVYMVFRILNIRMTHLAQDRLIITYPNTFESTLRDGAVQATPKYTYMGYAYVLEDVIAGYGTDHQASLKTLWEQITWFGPYLLEDIDNPGQGIGINIINNCLYLSFTLGWISIQFAADNAHIYTRKYYGNNGWTGWTSIQ